MSNVVELDVVTSLDIPAERVLRKAIDADLAGVVIVGYASNGDYYFASSIADGADVNWLLDQCKRQLLAEPSDMRGAPGAPIKPPAA